MAGIVYPQTNLPMLGKGSVLFNPKDANGVPQGFIHLGNVTTFALSQQDEKKELYSSINKSTIKISEVHIKRNVTFKITGTDFKTDNMKIFFQGDSGTVAQTGSTVTGETLASSSITKLGKIFRTAKRNISAITVHGGTTPTTLVLGTDYTVLDATVGLIYILPTSAIVGLDTSALTIDYTYATISVPVVHGATQSYIEGELHYVSDNKDGENTEVQVWRIRFSPTGDLNLISDDYASWTMEGDVLDDSANHPSAPLYQQLFL